MTKWKMVENNEPIKTEFEYFCYKKTKKATISVTITSSKISKHDLAPTKKIFLRKCNLCNGICPDCEALEEIEKHRVF